MDEFEDADEPETALDADKIVKAFASTNSRTIEPADAEVSAAVSMADSDAAAIMSDGGSAGVMPSLHGQPYSASLNEMDDTDSEDDSDLEADDGYFYGDGARAAKAWTQG